jgi:hypothetical protein
MKAMVCILGLVCVMSVIGCAGTGGKGESGRHVVSRLAVAPSSGILGDAVGIELSKKGFSVTYKQETATLLGGSAQLGAGKGLEDLRAKGIEAVLFIDETGSGEDVPEGATVRVTDTESGQFIAGMTWARRSGIGGWQRKSLADASEEIADALLQKMKPR